jgi:hypothetical protein
MTQGLPRTPTPDAFRHAIVRTVLEIVIEGELRLPMVATTRTGDGGYVSHRFNADGSVDELQRDRLAGFVSPYTLEVVDALGRTASRPLRFPEDRPS